MPKQRKTQPTPNVIYNLNHLDELITQLNDDDLAALQAWLLSGAALYKEHNKPQIAIAIDAMLNVVDTVAYIEEC